MTLPAEDRATATGNMNIHRKIAKDQRVYSFRHVLADRQAHRHTHTDVLITILPTAPTPEINDRGPSVTEPEDYRRSRLVTCK